jgi:hypothetical protein
MARDFMDSFVCRKDRNESPAFFLLILGTRYFIMVDMNKGKRNALIEHRKKQTKAKDKRRAQRTALKTSAKK